MKNKTIAIFSEYYPPHLGGLENYVFNIANKLNERGYKVVIITTRYSQTLKADEYENNIRILRYPVYKLFVNRYPLPKRNKEYRMLFAELAKEKIDFVILNTRFFLSSMIGANFSKKIGCANLVIEHGCEHLTVNNQILDYFGSLYEHCLTRQIAKKIDAYYGVSQACNDWLHHFHLQASGVLNGAVNIEERNLYPKQLNSQKIIFTYAGRLLKQKGLLMLVDAFITLSQKYDHIELYIAGKGDLLATLEKISKEVNNIHLLGYLNHEALMNQLSKTDVFVYTPIWPEGLGISVIEAGLLECTAIVSNQKGILEVVPNRHYGLIIDEQHSLVQCMETCINDTELRKKMAVNLNNRVIDVFSWDKTVDKLEEIIKVSIS